MRLKHSGIRFWMWAVQNINITRLECQQPLLQLALAAASLGLTPRVVWDQLPEMGAETGGTLGCTCQKGAGTQASASAGQQWQGKVSKGIVALCYKMSL